MREEDIKSLWSFLLRIGMYVGEESEGRISSFIHGYEVGSLNQCEFTSLLSDSIESDFNITYRATGWIGQIYRVAEKIETDWVTVFKSQSLKLLIKEFDNHSNSLELKAMYKKRVVGLLSNSDRAFDLDWILNWKIYTSLDAEQSNYIWTGDELDALTSLNEEIEFIKSNFSDGDKLEKSSKFINLELNLTEKINMR